MKKLTIIILMFAGSFQWNLCTAQSDSVKTETVFQQDNQYYYQNKYRYLDVRLSDEDHLLKIGIQPFKPSESFSFLVFTLHGGYEQKLNRSLTVISEINSVMTWSAQGAFHQQGISLGGRYYFLKARDIELGKSGNNCQGVYGLAKMSDLLYLLTVRSAETGSTNFSDDSKLYRGLSASLKPEIGIGIQQRLDYHLYFDASLSCNYDILNAAPGVEINFLFGGIFSFIK